MQVPPGVFACVCFAILMQNGEGINDKSPDYVEEKMWLLSDPVDCFAALDIHNMRKVKWWHQKWGVEMPPACADYLEKSEMAYRELADRGVEI